MLELSRRVRFSIAMADVLAAEEPPAPGSRPHDRDRWNTFAGWPSMHGIGLFCDVEVICRGQPDEKTGYLIGIGELDEAVRAEMPERLLRRIRSEPAVRPELVLAESTAAIADAIDPVHLVALRWRLTPWYAITLETAHMDRCVLEQQFDFAAAHHLWCDDRSTDENRKTFGKCTNPHGHNYRLRVRVAVPLEASGPGPLDLAGLERLVDESVIERLDHTDLNAQDELFAGRTPSVEHIARVCHELLVEPVAACGAALVDVTVWETEKTACTYPAMAPVG